MISTLKGTLTATHGLSIALEVGGVGYEVHVPLTTAERLPRIGESLFLHTHVVYREDAQLIYGFAQPQERNFFRLVIDKVSGVGPKIALGLLSKLPLSAIENAIAQEQVEVLSGCQGIGKKTAERLVIELKDKVGLQGVGPGLFSGPINNNPTVLPTSPESDTVQALISLGFKPAEAEKAVKKAVELLGKDASTEILLRKALG